MAHLLVSPAFKVFASCPQFSCQCQKDKRWIEPTAKPFLLLPETHLIVARRIQNGTFCWKLFMQLAIPFSWSFACPFFLPFCDVLTIKVFVMQDCPSVPIGRSPRTDVLLKVENIILEAGGCVLRLAGLYISSTNAYFLFQVQSLWTQTLIYYCGWNSSSISLNWKHKIDRGAHVFWLRKGTLDTRPDHIINQIHYEVRWATDLSQMHLIVELIGVMSKICKCMYLQFL